VVPNGLDWTDSGWCRHYADTFGGFPQGLQTLDGKPELLRVYRAITCALLARKRTLSRFVVVALAEARDSDLGRLPW
jgi:hypothetical protein